MADFTAYLRLAVDSTSATTAARNLVSLTGAAKLAGAAFAALGTGSLATDLFNITRQTGIMEASLRTATGSAENTEQAFAALVNLSSQLPENLTDVTTAFTKMVNLGLDPSEAALRSYSNTAAAMGKNLMQFVEAVADATTGEFERLKEFGIKASAQGDNVAFRFRGVTTSIKNDSDSIAGYLKSIGEVEFAGAAAERMKTLDGAVSNLGDTYDSLIRTVSKQGAGSFMTDAVRTATAALQELNDQIASGQLAGNLTAISQQVGNLAIDFTRATDTIRDAYNGLSDDTKNILSSTFTELPQNVRAFVQLTVTELLVLSEKVLAVGILIRESLNPSKAFSGDAMANFRTELERINGVRDDSIAAILREKDAATDLANSTRAQAKLAREAYDQNKANSAAAGDVLGKFKVTGEAAVTINKELIKLEKEKAESIASVLISLNDEYLQLTMSKDAYLAYTLASKGASKEQLTFAASTRKKIDQIEDEKRLIAELNDEQDRSIEKANKLAEDQKKAAADSAAEISKTITEGLMRGFESGKGIVENFRDTVENIFKTLVLRPAVEIVTDKLSKQISSLLGSFESKGADGKTNAGVGVLGALGPYGAIAAAVVGSVVGKWNDAQDAKFEKLTAAYRQGVQSTGTVLGEANKKSESIANAIDLLGDTASSTLDVNYGMYQALIEIRDGIAASAAGLARQGAGGSGDFAERIKTGSSGGGSLATGAAFAASAALSGTALYAIPVVGQFLAAGAIIGKILGGQFGGFVDSIIGGIGKAIYNKKTSISDSGIKIIGTTLADIIETGTLQAFSFADVKTKKSFIGITTSTKVKEQTDALDEIFKAQFASVFVSAGTALQEASKAFGLEFDPAKFLVDATKLSLKGLEGDALTKEIESFFSSTLDAWASFLVGGTDTLLQFQKVGEGAFETVIRLASETNTFAQYASLLSLNFNAVGLSAIGITQNIAELSGGFDSLSNSLGAYYQNFFTDSERTAAGLSQIGDKLKTIGVDAVPTSREAFRALIEAIDLTTTAGQEQFSTLISLSGAFAQLVPATKEATDATNAAADAAKKLADIASERATLENDLLQLQGDTNAIRAAELTLIDESNRALKQQIYDLIDAKKAEEEANKKAAETAAYANQVRSQSYDLEIRQLEALGHSSEALALQRAKELESLDESNRQLLLDIYAIEDYNRLFGEKLANDKAAADEVERIAKENADNLIRIAEAAAQQAEKIANERYSIEDKLLNLQGNTAEIRARELASLDESNRALQQQIYALNDQKEAADAAAKANADAAGIIEKIASERLSLENQLLQAQGKTAEIRARELASLDESNRAIQEQIYALDDQAKANADAASIAEKIAGEKLTLEGKLLQLQGNTAELRARELAAIDESNKSIQQQIYDLEDLKNAQNAAAEAADKAAQSIADYAQKLKDTASSALDGLRSSVEAEKARINGVVESASSAKSAIESAVSAEKDRLKSSLDDRLSAIKAQADAEKEAQDAIAKARVDSIKEQQSAVADSIKSMESLSSDLSSTIADMAIGSDKLTLARRRAAEFEIDTALANARAGRGLPLAGQLTSSLGIVKQNDPALYRNAAEMAFATAVTQNKLAELAKITGESISDSQRQLDILNAQLVSAESYSGASLSKYDEMIKAANDQYALDVSALDATAKTAQEQYDALTGIDSSVLSLGDALARYADIIAGAGFSNAKEQIERLDAQLLKAENQLNALLGIDNSVLSLKDSVDKFIASLTDLNADLNKDNVAALEAIAVQIQGLRDEQRVQSLKQVTALETTARNTASIAYDTVPT